MKYYDIQIHSDNSIGQNSIDEIVQQARKLDLSGVTIADYFDDTTKIEKIREITKKYTDIDVSLGVVIGVERIDELRSKIKMFRNLVDVIIVHGGNYQINRAASENPYVDVISHPELDRIDGGIDHIVAKNMHENDIALEINFREILESVKKQRVNILSNIRKNIFLAKKYEVPIVTASGAINIWQMRSGRDIASFSNLLGLDLSESVKTTSTTPERIITQNRDKISGKLIHGVKVSDFNER